MSPFTAWLSDPRPERGIHLADDAGGWDYSSYVDLAASARRVAAELVSEGVGPGDVVTLIMPTGYGFVRSLFAVWATGATVCPIVTPNLQSEEEYVTHVAAILDQAEPALTITGEEFAPLVTRAMERAGRPGEPWIPREGTEQVDVAPDAEIALLQFTSGSTGEPRGVRVAWDNLEANFAVIRRWTGYAEGDEVASWLPLNHDMGLIGTLLVPIALQATLWLMRPEQFIRDPARWLACFDKGKARHSAAPSFAFAYAARRVKPEQMAALDLSEWRSVMVGAEMTDAVALETFARFAESAGFSRRTYAPAYGLAENTLGVVSPGRGHVPRMLKLNWSALRFGEKVLIEETADLGEGEAEPGTGWLVGHGGPAEGDDIEVGIADEDGQPLSDGVLGEIVVSGTSVARGYHAGRVGRSTRFADGRLWTGDAGFLHDGHLYVLGRMGESLKVRGRSVYVEDLDAKVAAAAGLGKGRVAVVGMNEGGRVGVAIFAEAEVGPWTEKATRALRSELGPEPVVTIVAGPRGLVQRTSSGKPRRRHMWQQLQAGLLTDVQVIKG